ncbi:DEAD/DEAH box helicase family protein [Myxococcus stipitatus]|uniref:DEAD/DEAH box helicase family protein n=1 Tax=Myxococcus stipitatus TaxID=83455 RepID=UPI001F31E9A3|nr:DEAD/DEAH box helicase family protein [Myxococcus stipitatus]MCE9671991.1 DEAD/DEAH box helicase family protein [Myxococcus stipitatus]
MAGPLELHFDCGTLVAPTLPEDPRLLGLFQKDGRTGVYRAPAWHYREVVLRLRELGVAYEDRARRFEPLDVTLAAPIQPFPHQQQALDAWTKAGGRGLVELPTGAGKTLLAVLAIAHVKRPTLVVVPTLDLMAQWQGVLSRHFARPVGMLGGGVNDRQPLTVTTYDSAALQTEFHGNRFGLLVCDECHHLPAPSYRFIAEGSLAPYRLGLTATLERTDGGERVCEELLGPRVHRSDIRELQGEYLAPYEVKRVEVPLTEHEKARYDAARARYLDFVRKLGVRLSAPDGWARFLAQSQRSDEGRAAYRAYREQRRIALTSSAKQQVLWRILLEHREDRVLVFTDDNETVYTLARRFFLPALTHHTPVPERKALLAAFASGELPVLLTSRVLNEGVDVPDARVGVVLSGSGSVREHVQRLGRILRKRPGKRALLYEVCSAQTAESGISERRRQHGAYQEEG